MERAKQLGKIDARCILETAGHLIDHASRVTYELRGVELPLGFRYLRNNYREPL